MLRATVIGFILLLSAVVYSGQGRPGEQAQRVTVSDLTGMSGMYNQKTVIVTGELRGGDSSDYERQVYRLRGDDVLREIRVGQPGFGGNDMRFIQGHKVEITGIFWDLSQECYDDPRTTAFCYDRRLQRFPAIRENYKREENRYFIGVIHVDSLEMDTLPELEEPTEEPDLDIVIAPGDLVDLRTLLGNSEPFIGKKVSVIGKFRGNNLYSDLSIRTKKTPRDFVIKVADAAIWVTGRRPRGKGFELNPRMRRDTGKWLKVTGTPWMDDGMTYLKAEMLEIVPEPDDPDLEPVDPAEEEAAAKELGPPPEIFFSLPLDGERGIPLDSEFRVQFSNDMASPSFDRNVDLLYADDDGIENPFPGMQIRYEELSRTLVVIPGSDLQPGREIQLILYSGIVDEDGQGLVVTSRAEEFPDSAAVLTFFTADR